MLGRRDLLGLAGLGTATILGRNRLTRSPLSLATSDPTPVDPSFVPTVDVDDVEAHVARRLTFGLTPEVLEDVHERGWREWIAWQLHPQDVGTSDVLEQAVDLLPSTSMSPEDLLRRTRQDRLARRTAEAAGASEAELRALREEELRPAGETVLATVLRAVHAPTQLHELLVDHWSNHFNVHIAKTPATAVAKGVEDRDVIRPGALGTFSDLLLADARSPAMLAYLDQASSRADGAHTPNENYAREVLELHTVGVADHDEADVLAMAHVLAGWTVDLRLGTFAFRAAWHADGPQTVAGFTTVGTRGPDAVSDGEEVLAHLARHRATARNVVTRLARRFVSDAPSPELVDAVAATYLANDTALRPTLEHLLTSDEFVGSAGRKLKRPFELLTSSLRAMRWPVPDLQAEDQRLRLGGLHRRLEQLGNSPFGWPAPNGYPDVAGAWRNAGALMARWNLAQALTGAWEGPERTRSRASVPALADGSPLLAVDGGPDEAVAALAPWLDPTGDLGPGELDLVASTAASSSRPAGAVVAALLLDARTFQYR